MHALYTLVFLMFIAILLVGVAQKARISYPVALVVGGALLGFIPHLAPINVDPLILLFIVLPPILFYASYSLSFKEFILYFRDIFSLAIGLVIATTCVVAFLFKWLFPESSWALAFAFGALIAPPDAVAVTAILNRFSLSSRLITILEGESLINDASGLVIYRFAVIALMTGSFSLQTVIPQALYVVIGGIACGLIAGYVLNKISIFLNPVLTVAYSFIIPYLTYSFANFLGVSGVLAVVSCGLVGARMLITEFNPLTRVLVWASWDIVVVLLNCFIFILIGLEFRFIVERMTLGQIGLYAAYGFLITVAIILTRFVWIYIRRLWWHFRVRKDPSKLQQSKTYLIHAVLSSWAGMRGVVSLTAALALPLSLPDGMPLISRDIVLFLTFEIIFLTIIIPSLTLPLLIKWLHIQSHLSHQEMLQTRRALVDIAIKEIHQLYALKQLNEYERELLHTYFTSQHKIREIFSISEEDKIEKARHQILQKQREYLMDMWRNDKVNDTLMSHLERELDIEESHLARGELY